jgi:hypothetical protein
MIRVLLEKLIVAQLAEKYPAVYETQRFIIVRFQVLTAARMKMTVFWIVEPCSLVEVYRRFVPIALMMDAASTSETSVNFCKTKRRINPEDSHLRLLSFSQESVTVPYPETEESSPHSHNLFP